MVEMAMFNVQRKTRGPWATARPPVTSQLQMLMQQFSNPIIATNEKLII